MTDPLHNLLAKVAEAIAAVDSMPPPHSFLVQAAREKLLSAEANLLAAQKELSGQDRSSSRFDMGVISPAQEAGLRAVAAIITAKYFDPRPSMPADPLQPGDVFRPGPACYAMQQDKGRVWLSDRPDVDEESGVEEPPAGAGELQELSLIVVEAALGGGGMAMGPNDVYPDGWNVKAKRVIPGTDSPDPESPEYEFYQSGCFINKVAGPVIFLRRAERR